MKDLAPGTHRIPLPFGGVRRSYLLHVPPGTGPVPLVMMIHGAGGSAEFAAEETGWSSLADEQGFAVVYPEGVPPNPEKDPKFLTNPQEWNDGSGRGTADDMQFVREVLGDLSTWTEIDEQQQYLTGFSNGAGMVFRFVAEHPTIFQAIGPIAGHCWVTPKRLPPIRTMYFIGEADPILPLSGGLAHTPWGRKPNRPPVQETLDRWSQAINRPINSPDFPVFIIKDHGHHWPGGLAKLGPKLGGPVSEEYDANRMLWSFFQKQSTR